MIQDPSNRYIAAILSQYDIRGKDVLEIGCGRGRITRDLARHARRVVATDPDREALATAGVAAAAPHVAFMEAPAGLPVYPEGSFDVVIYTLSLHHVPVAAMAASLTSAAAMLKKEGVIMILEPGDHGSFMQAKATFGVGSGDEAPARAAAIKAMHTLAGWDVGKTHHFYTAFLFASYADFFAALLPDFNRLPDEFIADVKQFLSRHLTANGFVLDAERRLNVLRRNNRRDKNYPETK